MCRFSASWKHLIVLFISWRFFNCICCPSALAEADLEEMAMHETEDNKVFQRFKKRIASEPHQVKKNFTAQCYEKSHRCSSLWAFDSLSSHPGDTLQSRRLFPVGFLSSHPFRWGYPTMHLWNQADVWVSGHYWFQTQSNLNWNQFEVFIKPSIYTALNVHVLLGLMLYTKYF